MTVLTVRPLSDSQREVRSPSSQRRALDLLAVHHLPLQSALSSLELPPERRLLAAWPRAGGLAARAWHVLAQAAWTGSPVRYLGTMPLFAGHRVYAGAKTDWVVRSLAIDPLLGDGLPVPDGVRADPRRIRQRIDFDARYVAHEVPAGSIVALWAGGAAPPAGANPDPVLLGVVVRPNGRVEPGEPAAWFYLGRSTLARSGSRS